MDQILFRTEVSLGSLDRRVAEQQLDLLKLAAGGAAHFRACATVVRCDVTKAGGVRIRA